MVTLENLFSPACRDRLAAAIPQRVSCRAYTAAPSFADWAALSYAAGRYSLPGARLMLLSVSESLFTGTLLGMGKVTGCTAIAVVIASLSEPRSRIHAGILGEAFCLEAVAMGLGCCWISGTYKKKQLTPPLSADETVLAIIALGVPEKGAAASETRKRKSLEKLCDGDISLWPEELRQVAAAVQLAPSAMNLQPWVMTLEADRFILDAPDRSQLDLGIALTHAELTLRTPHTWHFGDLRRDPAAWAQVREK